MSDFQRKIFQRLKTAEAHLGLDFDENIEKEEEEKEEPPSDSANPSTSTLTSTSALTPTSSLSPPSFTSKVPRTKLMTTDTPAEGTPTSIPQTSTDPSSFFNQFQIETPYKLHVYQTKPQNSNITILCHHGAGSSGMSFAQLAQSLPQMNDWTGTPGLLTFDMRSHGKSAALNPFDNYDLSLNSLTNDLAHIIKHFFKLNSQSELILLGHSLGGSVCTNLLFDEDTNPITSFSGKRISMDERNKIKGLIIIDIVEQTAIKSLSSMNTYLSTLPKFFPSIQDGINWHTKNLINNSKSANLSIPNILKLSKNGWTWITNLKLTEPHWNSWFDNLSSKFINVSGPKMLILANNDYLDKPLIVGQMQGKYQLVVFRNQPGGMATTQTKVICDSIKVGHFVQEDVPVKLAFTIAEFCERNLGLPRKDGKGENELINKLNKKWGRI
ncbi:carboxylesterase-mitochondrial 37S ribosomal protein YmS2 [Martiniozyma asiatica (nom. inval.)]|nr:carboxylesterase-mitochondrial 37S ribosomal protein YmS2 [Martiniozyma asiatica]